MRRKKQENKYTDGLIQVCNHAINPSLEKKIKQKLFGMLCIPNFMRIIDLLHYGDSLNLIFAKDAYRVHSSPLAPADRGIIFVGPANDVLVVKKKPKSTDYKHKSYTQSHHHTTNAELEVHAAVFLMTADCLFAVVSRPEQVTSKNKQEVAIKSATGDVRYVKLQQMQEEAASQAVIKALGAISLEGKPYLAVSYNTRAIELYDANTGQFAKVLEMPTDIKSVWDTNYAYRFCYCDITKFMSLDDNSLICAAFTDGTIKVYESNGLLHNIKLPQLMTQEKSLTMMSINKEVLTVGALNGHVYIIDWKKRECIKVLESPRRNFSPVTCEDLNERLMAIGYEDGKTCIWDRIDGKIIKMIIRADTDQAIPRRFNVIRGKLEIIYSDLVVDHYFIPEIASLNDLIFHLQEVRNLGFLSQTLK